MYTAYVIDMTVIQIDDHNPQDSTLSAASLPCLLSTLFIKNQK